MTIQIWTILALLTIIIAQTLFIFHLMDAQIVLNRELQELQDYKFTSEQYLSPVPGIEEKTWKELVDRDGSFRG